MLTINNTLDGYLKDVEIKGNTIQDSENLADIRSVGDKVEGQELYEIPVLSCGKNLFNPYRCVNPSFTLKNGMYSGNTSSYYVSLFQNSNGLAGDRDVSKLMKIKKGNYFITFKSNTSSVISVASYDKDGKCIAHLGEFSQIRGISLDKDCYLDIRIANKGVFEVFDIQIEEGTQATPYEPYQEDKLTILSPVQLEKVGDVADRIIEKNGVWGVEKNIVTESAEATYDITKIISNIGNNTNQFNINLPSTSKNHPERIPVLSSLFIGGKAWESPSLVDYECIGAYKDKLFCVKVLKTRADTVDEFKKLLPFDFKYPTTQPTFIPLPHSQQIKLRTFANKTNISFLTEIEGTIKAQVPKSLGATVNTHTEQISNLNKELDRVKKLEESTVSTVTTESGFTTVEATSNGYFEDVRLEGKTLVNIMGDSTQVVPGNLNGNTGLEIVASAYCRTDFIQVNNSCISVLFSNFSLNYRIHKVAFYDSDKNFIKQIENNATTNTVYRISEKFSYIRVVFGKPITQTEDLDINIIKNTIKPYILEGDHTQNPPSYFEGLKSAGQSATTSEDGVDEIVVSSVKGDGNLFDYTFTTNKAVAGDGSLYTNNSYNASDYVRVIPNCTYIRYGNDDMCPYDKNKNALGQMIITNQGVFTTNSNTHFVRFNVHNEQVSDFRFNKGIELLDTPHQSDKKRLLYYNNETQAWEKPILREWDSIEKHSDGKYYYHKRCEQVVLNGSENWGIYNSTVNNTFSAKLPILDNMLPHVDICICDIFRTLSRFDNIWENDLEGISITQTSLAIRIDKSKLSTQDVEGFKQWLQTNNVTVVYQLAQEKVYECTNIDLITYSGETNFIVESGVLTPRTTLKVHNNISNVVSLLQKKVSLLESNVTSYMITQNRLQLSSTYSADSVTFKVDYAVCSENRSQENYNTDLYNLILNNILVGKDNYDYDHMLNIIMDYASWSQISWGQFDILVGIMELQHNPPIEPPIEEVPCETPEE